MEEKTMKNIVLNNMMNLEVPEGFAEITAEEVQEMTLCKGPAPMWNVINRDEHMLITASWFKPNRIVSFLFNARDMAKAVLNNYKSGLEVESPYAGTYSDICETTVDGNKAYTFSCTYRAFTKDGELMDMIRETVVVKIKDVFYVFQSVCRNEMKDEGIRSFHKVYDSVQFAAAA
jgi:hypothetical protein